MSIEVVLNQMIVIFLLMMIGYIMYKKDLLNDISIKHISGLIINIFNPALLISSAINENRIASTADIILVSIIAFTMFLILIVIGFFLPRAIGCTKAEYSTYQLLTIFGNIGFIGIPVTASIFGTGAVIYTTLFNIPYNILAYTYGVHLINKTPIVNKGKSNTASTAIPTNTIYSNQTTKKENAANFNLKKILNIGTIASLLSIFLFLINPALPAFIKTSANYLGNAAVALSLIVIGTSLAKLPFKNIFTNVRLYLFSAIRLLIIPIAAAILLKPLFSNSTILGVTILVLSMPCGNLPVLLSQEQGQDNETLACGVVLTTILSLITITIVSLFV